MTALTRDNLQSLAREALATFGNQMQVRRFTEECGEAVTAAMKLHDDRSITYEQFAEEVVGVLITAAQMERFVVELVGVEGMNRIWLEQLTKLAKAIDEACPTLSLSTRIEQQEAK